MNNFKPDYKNHDRGNKPFKDKFRGPITLGNNPTKEQTIAFIKHKLTSTMVNPNTIGVDGVDHINISHLGSTELGKILNPGFRRQFSLSKPPILDNEGKIIEKEVYYSSWACLSGFKQWLSSEEQDSRLRTMTGATPEKYGVTRRHVAHFKAVMLMATYFSLERMPEQHKKLFLDSVLPFDNYKTKSLGENTVTRQRTHDSGWIIVIYEELRRAAKEGRDPYLEAFMDEKSLKAGIELYDDIIFGQIQVGNNADAEVDSLEPEESSSILSGNLDIDPEDIVDGKALEQ